MIEPQGAFQVVIVFDSLRDWLISELERKGLVLFKMPLEGDDLPTYGIRLKDM